MCHSKPHGWHNPEASLLYRNARAQNRSKESLATVSVFRKIRIPKIESRPKRGERRMAISESESTQITKRTPSHILKEPDREIEIRLSRPPCIRISIGRLPPYGKRNRCKKNPDKNKYSRSHTALLHQLHCYPYRGASVQVYEFIFTNKNTPHEKIKKRHLHFGH